MLRAAERERARAYVCVFLLCGPPTHAEKRVLRTRLGLDVLDFIQHHWLVVKQARQPASPPVLPHTLPLLPANRLHQKGNLLMQTKIG